MKYNFKLYHLQVFLVLLLALLLCSFLGGNCNKEGMTNVKDADHDHNNNLLQNPSDVLDNLSGTRNSVRNEINNAKRQRVEQTLNDPNTVNYSTIKKSQQMNNEMINNELNGTRPPASINAIPKSSIPSGQEELYVLRSEVSNLLNKPSCQPCPPCGRCPEPSFSCKKVPNYNNIHSENNYLPKPVLSDFSTFAM